jgi:hypothetical protein
MMKFLKIYILYRLYFALGLLIAGVLSHLFADLILAWILYVLAVVSVVLHFMIGTMRLVKDAVEDGDADNALRLIRKIKYPNLLIKPIRSAYFMLQSTLSMANNDLSTAESNIRKSLNTKSSLAGDMQGTNLMQLGFIQMRQGKTKEGSLAGVYLQLCTLEIQRHQNKMGKIYFKKAKALNPKSKEISEQLKIMEKSISRLPG